MYFPLKYLIVKLISFKTAINKISNLKEKHRKSFVSSFFCANFRNLPLFDVDSNHYITRYQTASYGVKNIKFDLLNGHWITFKINKTESDTESKTLRVKNIYSLVGKVPQGCIFFISDYLKWFHLIFISFFPTS